LNITFTASSKETYKFIITDLTGRVLESKNFELITGPNNVSFNINNDINNGIYVISVADRGNMKSRIFVLSRQD
ncbi:MAG: T9SS type A sorting domain-containing protein, partial [Bacteroidales bacterium]|nr:T9SS type A sorting domain-containing protein [Bacteroidales bacterium]